MAKRILIKKIEELFYKIKKHPWHQKLVALPYPIKVICAIFLIIFGIAGIIIPVIPGGIFLLLACVLLLGLHVTKRYLFRGIYMTRVHIFFSRIYFWWKNK